MGGMAAATGGVTVTTTDPFLTSDAVVEVQPDFHHGVSR
jgi:hypothetical protein